MESPNHFLCLGDRDREAIERLLERARAFRGSPAELERTREHVKAGRVAARWTDDEVRMQREASGSSVPVINWGCALGDPVQLLADVLTAHDHFGFPSVTVAFFGDANVGIGRSYVEAVQALRLALRVVPSGGSPRPAVGDDVYVTSEARAAIRGAQLVVGAPALPALSDEERGVAAKGALFVNERAERARNRAAIEAAIVEEMLATTLPPRLAAWRATLLSERFAISAALHRIASEHLARDERSCGGTVARGASVEVFASRRDENGLTLSLVYDYRIDEYAQSGSDWANHHVRTADVTFTGSTLARWVETSTVTHNVPEHGSSDYDDRGVARAARDAAIVKLGEVSPAEPPPAVAPAAAAAPAPVAARADVCICAQAQVGKRFLDHGDSVDGREMNQIVAGCEVVSESPEICTSRYRCRVCGTQWVKEMWDSGPMTWTFIRPSPRAW